MILVQQFQFDRSLTPRILEEPLHSLRITASKLMPLKLLSRTSWMFEIHGGLDLRRNGDKLNDRLN